MTRLIGSLPLTLRLPILGAAIMILVGLGASYQVFTGLVRLQDDHLREIARLHLESLSIALGPPVLRRDVWEVFDVLDRAGKATEGQRLGLTIVTDPGGRVIAASDPRRAPVDSVIDLNDPSLQRLSGLSMDGGGPADRPDISVLVPLTYQDRAVGAVIASLDVSDLAAERRRTVLLLVGANVLLTLVLALAGYVVLRRMVRPIALLASHIASHSGLPEPIPAALIPAGDRDLARLFETYNQMAAATEAKTEMERRLAERERFVGLGRLASSLAHEINNPLGGLLNATDTILAYPDRPDVVRRSAALIETGIRHLRDVTRAILEQHRLDPFAAPLTVEDLEHLRLLVEPEVRRRGQSLHWRIEPFPAGADLPAAPVRQIVLNLVLNAAAAAPEGGHVALLARVEAAALDLAIRDNGPGLSHAAQMRLLTDEPLQAGGGIGLRMVRDLATGLGGTVSVRREDGETEIRVNLPLGRDQRR